MYEITEYTKQKAKTLGVKVKPSSNPKKKIDVFKDREKIASIGAIGYGDYPTFIKEKGIEYAKKRQTLYKKRHEKDRKVKGSTGMLADLLLW
jgi:hypothetical protein